MAIARLHNGPLDGQVLPLDDEAQTRIILPYSQTQVVYVRDGGPRNTGDADGPTEVPFRFEESEDDIDPDPDGRDE